jgi:hypothetical protein
MAAVFSELKWRGQRVEMAPEFVKDLVWEDRKQALGNQIYVFACQLQRIMRIEHQVDYIVTDSPLLLSLVYGQDESPEFQALVHRVNLRFDNLNFLLTRSKVYDGVGRYQDEEQAELVCGMVKDMLRNENVEHLELVAKKEVERAIANQAMFHRNPHWNAVCSGRGNGQPHIGENADLSVCAFCGEATGQ